MAESLTSEADIEIPVVNEDISDSIVRDVLFTETEITTVGQVAVSGTGVKSAVVDEAAYIKIRLPASPEAGSRVRLTVKLVSISSPGRTTIGEMIERDDKTNTMTYRYVPLKRGDHRLHVQTEDQVLYSRTISVGMPLKMRCIPNIALEKVVNRFGGIAIGPSGQIAFVDSYGAGYKTIHIYSSGLRGQSIVFGDWGKNKDKCLYWPTGIAFDRKGQNIFVTDTYNHRIHKFNTRGSWIATVGVTKGKGRLEFSRPTGIGVHPSGRIYVCDRDNNRVQILTHDLKYFSKIEGGPSSRANLLLPWDVAFDAQGDVYVVDAGHKCIKRFSQTEKGVKFIRTIGPAMYGTEALLSPEMICVDDCGYIFVTDGLRHEVIVFDIEGAYHLCFGTKGSAKGQFNHPRGIAKAQDGAIYVTETGNKRLQVFC